MKFNRKHYGMKRRSSGGQAILEYIIIIALVAVTALTVLGLFGDKIRQLIAGTTSAISNDSAAADAAGENGDSLQQKRNMDKNGPSEINF